MASCILTYIVSEASSDLASHTGRPEAVGRRQYGKLYSDLDTKHSELIYVELYWEA